MEINKETEITEPFPHAVAALEGKIKSLQQLKKSTESLKKAQRSGHSLDSEQRSLVARLEEVQCSLKNLLHVQRQFANIARDSASERRQRALRTELERTRQDITRIKEILLVQDVLENMRKEEVRKDFLCGQNGAVRLSEEALDNLDDFYVEISLVRGTADEFPAFQDQLQQSAEHLLALVDGREAEIIGTTYAKLKGVITAICMSGYFDYLAKETSLYSGAAQSRGAGEKGCGEDDAEMADRCIASSQAVARDNVKACNGFKRSPQEVVSSSTEEEIAKELPSSVAGRQNGSMLPQVRKSTRVKVASRRLSGYVLESCEPVSDNEKELQEKSLSCSVCKAVFHNQYRLQYHMRTHTAKSLSSCEVNKKKFTFSTNREDHVQTNAIKKQYDCKLCKVKFPMLNELKKHLHKHISKNPVVSFAGKNYFSCIFCGASFPKKRTVVNHIETHCDERPFVCNICKATFSGKLTHAYHMSHVHGVGAPFHCSVCKAPFSKQADLWSHSTSHPSEFPLSCSVCKARFSAKRHLKDHMASHAIKEDEFHCAVCGGIFYSRSSIVGHMRNHSGKKRFRCSICGIIFSRKGNFQKHMLIHCSQKEFSLPDGRGKWKTRARENKVWDCRYCEAVFASKGELVVHSTVHDEEKPCSCPVCGAKFSGDRSLASHMRTHSSERPFCCTVCKAKFGYSNSLKHHMLTHSGEKPFKCNICGCRFTRKDNCKSHMFIHFAKEITKKFKIS